MVHNYLSPKVGGVARLIYSLRDQMYQSYGKFSLQIMPCSFVTHHQLQGSFQGTKLLMMHILQNSVKIFPGFLLCADFVNCTNILNRYHYCFHATIQSMKTKKRKKKEGYLQTKKFIMTDGYSRASVDRQIRWIDRYLDIQIKNRVGEREKKLKNKGIIILFLFTSYRQNKTKNRSSNQM